MRNIVEKQLSWLALLVTAFYSLLASSKASEECGHEKLVQCVRPLEKVDKNDFLFVTNKEDLEELCPNFENSMKCIQTYTVRCLKETQREHFNSLYKGTNMLIMELCQDGPYQDEFLKHAPCMQKVKNEYEPCYKKYYRATQEIERANRTMDQNGRLKSVCCVFKEYLECSHHAVRRQCGDDTAQFTKEFVDRMSSFILKTHCAPYTHEECAIGSSASISRVTTLVPVVVVLIARYFT